MTEIEKAVNAERERCLKIVNEWLSLFGEKDPQYVSVKTWATDAIRDIADLIRTPTSDH